MGEQPPNPQINMSKLPVAGNIGGAIFAIGCMLIVLIGIPAIRSLFPVAVAVGCAVAIGLHFIRPKVTGQAWIAPATEK